jgi:hypothetical protein
MSVDILDETCQLLCELVKILRSLVNHIFAHKHGLLADRIPIRFIPEVENYR